MASDRKNLGGTKGASPRGFEEKKRTPRARKDGEGFSHDSRRPIPVRRERNQDAPMRARSNVEDRRPAAPSASVPPCPSEPLFPVPGAKLASSIDQMLLRALRKAWPLKRAHKATLAADISELSEMLTFSRSELRRPYWASPALTSAYLYYFLPWNVVRLVRLFRGLDIPSPEKTAKGTGRPAMLVDLGSGPLTLPIALWLARPEWRNQPVEVVAVDCAGRPPHLGRDILCALAEEADCPPWKVHVIQAPVDRAARRMDAVLKDGPAPWLVCAANVLNELPPSKHEHFDEEDGAEETLPGSCELLLESLMPLLRGVPGQETAPRVLFVEPGTRLGGTTLMRMRSAALDAGMNILAPCTHEGSCPLLREEEGLEEEVTSRVAGRSWCHFTFPCDGAPAWLAKLSEEAGLAKESLSLACLLLRAGEDCGAADTAGHEEKGLSARIISQPFAVPGVDAKCRYACSGEGLLLVGGANALASGSLVVLPEAGEDRDKRSGARIVRLGRCEGPRESGRERAGVAERPSARRFFGEEGQKGAGRPQSPDSRRFRDGGARPRRWEGRDENAREEGRGDRNASREESKGRNPQPPTRRDSRPPRRNDGQNGFMKAGKKPG